MKQGQVRIGTSGYQYDHWRGVFYPPALPKARWFDHYGRTFDTVEINNTFYGLPRPETFEAWRAQAPEGFCYALKFSRYGSHLKHLKDPERALGAFLPRADVLGAHLGPILVQLPPRWSLDADRLEGFLRAAPSRYRWVVEFRDPSWLCPTVFEILRAHRAALCVHDMIEGHPRKPTTDWIYLRFHGDHYQGSYSPQFLTARAREIRSHVREGRDVYAYFNNDAEGHAVRNALDLRRYVQPRS
jgi:uncharacterized protein YecE (DUF72 family)